jgi:membrane protease subunit HflK
VPVLTRDENIVNRRDQRAVPGRRPALYLFGTRNADRVLEQAAQSTVREQVGRADLDTVLGARPAVGDRPRPVAEVAGAYRTGLNVTELNLPNARPPEEVKPAFDDVNSAQQDKDLVNEAIAPMPPRWCPRRAARPLARAPVPRATRPRRSRVRPATRRASACWSSEYKAAPDVTRKRLWLETVQDRCWPQPHCSRWRRPPADLRADARRQGPRPARPRRRPRRWRRN